MDYVLADNSFRSVHDIEDLSEEQKAAVVSLIARILWEIEELASEEYDFHSKSYDPATIGLVKRDGKKAYAIASYVFAPSGRSFVVRDLQQAIDLFAFSTIVNLATEIAPCEAEARALATFYGAADVLREAGYDVPSTSEIKELYTKHGHWYGSAVDELRKRLCRKQKLPDGVIDISDELLNIAKFSRVSHVGVASEYARIAHALQVKQRASDACPTYYGLKAPLACDGKDLVLAHGYSAVYVDDPKLDAYGRVYLVHDKAKLPIRVTEHTRLERVDGRVVAKRG